VTRYTFHPKDKKMRHLFTNGTDTFIAETASDVLTVYEEHTGEPYTYDEEWDQLSDDESVDVGFEDDFTVKEELIHAEHAGADLSKCIVITKAMGNTYPDGPFRYGIHAKASWWALQPSGFLYSTEW